MNLKILATLGPSSMNEGMVNTLTKEDVDLFRRNFDVLMVLVISPIDHFRKMARKNLEPFFYLIYPSSSINSLKKRDPKGWYEKADRGKLQT